VWLPAGLQVQSIRFTDLRYFISQLSDAFFDGILHAHVGSPRYFSDLEGDLHHRQPADVSSTLRNRISSTPVVAMTMIMMAPMLMGR
jgi:hypothetical protein